MQERACSKVGNAKAKILRAVIEVYPEAIARDELAGRIEVSCTSGGYFNNLGSLRTNGLVHYLQKKIVALTVAGRAIAEPMDVPTTNAELHQQLFARLSGSQVRILKVLIRSYPGPLVKNELAELAEQSPTSGGYFNNLGRLRSLGLIDYPASGMAVASSVLFLDR